MLLGYFAFPKETVVVPPPPFFFSLQHLNACCAMLWETDTFLLWPEMNVRIQLAFMKKAFV